MAEMRRVCMLVRGSCTHDARVLKEAKSLAQAGYEVTIIASLVPGVARAEEREGFRIVRIPLDPFYLKVLLSLYRLTRRLLRLLRRPLPREDSERAAREAGDEKSGTDSLRLAQMLGWLPRPVRSLLLVASVPVIAVDYIWRVFWSNRGIPADVYHAHDFNTLPAGFFMARLRHAKLVYDSHELNLEAGRWAEIRGWPKRLLRLQEGFLARRADAVITVNQSLAQRLSSWYDIPNPGVVMNCPEPLAGAPESFLLHKKLGLPPDSPLVLYQGGLTPGRGLRELIVSFKDVETAVAVLMGYGPLREELEQLSQQLGLSDKVCFLEAVPPEELLAHTASAKVGVVCYQATSLNNYLATPNKIFEYLMAGVPVAISDFPEMANIVRKNDLGEVFDPEDPASIAAAINRLLRRPDYEEMRRRAEMLARTRYSWEFESEKLRSIYRSLDLPTPAVSEGSEPVGPHAKQVGGPPGTG